MIETFGDFKNACNNFGIEINNNQLDLFKKYYEILIEWNKKINLISRKQEDFILEKHFLDSIIFLPESEDLCRGVLQYAPTVLDIGSGGGFPAIPLAIMKVDWHFTLCESIRKKTIFLTHLVKELGLKNVEIVNDRIETLHATSLHKFDLITARAVAKLDKLIKYSLPLLKKGGYLIAYKSKNLEEIKNVKKQIFTKEINGIIRKLVVISF
ncbi:MAG: 16S rRNA (guanine(527)-N(7))-methyltransferase RsmG [Candidatus Melainabacteria bacterium]|nr:16S rRNA (guanine(527)-N(7))-methyltransferase RsmG [Candidatus Melainabacteria bacterium]